jgi:hypothetical protein
MLIIDVLYVLFGCLDVWMFGIVNDVNVRHQLVGLDGATNRLRAAWIDHLCLCQLVGERIRLW